MHQLRLLILLLIVNFMTVAVADTTAKLRGPKEFDAPAVTRLGPLSAHDTLWRLAEQARPDPRLNMYQVMHALYLKNPDAFLEQNFNHLKPGSYLEIPTIREILAINAAEAQRKSENDDRLWAEKIRGVANAKPEEKAARQQDVAKATKEITEELSRVESQQTEQMSDIRDRLGASMANVETIVVENTQLKKQLDTVVEELNLVKSKLDKDSEIQTQLQQLLQQQTELLEQQREQIRKAEEGFNFAETWQKLAASPVGWAIAASLPAIMLLLIIVSFIRRRGQKAAAVVSAATASPTVDPNYRSPLPPLDDSLDFDESSLINLDDSLLNDRMHSGIRLDDDNFVPKAAKPVLSSDFADDLLDDSFDSPSPVNKGSSEFDLDDLLDDPLDAPAAPRTEFDANNILSGDDLSSLFENLDEEPTFEAKADFDPKNILSDNDLSSLFGNLEEAEDPDDIFAQALAVQDAAAAKPADASDADALDEFNVDQPLAADALQNAAAQADEFDELLEEIELDIPSDADDIMSLDEDFDIDALMAQTQAAQSTPPAPAAAAPMDDDFDIDSLLAANAEPVAGNAATAAPSNVADLNATDFMADASQTEQANTFDSTELDAFAESLAEETLTDTDVSEITEAELDAVAAEFALEDEHITEAVEPDEAELASELDDILSEVAEIRAQSQLQAASLAELSLPESAVAAANEDFEEAQMSVAGVSSMLQDNDDDDDSANHHRVDAQPVVTISTAIHELGDSDEILLDDIDAVASPSGSEELSEFATLEDDFNKTPMPDLEELDDNSVSRLYESLSSVERPSKVLDEYPELEMSDDLLADSDADLIFPDDDLNDDLTDEAALFERAFDGASAAEQSSIADERSRQSDPTLLAELNDLEHTNFDEMLSELDQFETATVEPEQDLQSAKRVLAELDATQQTQQNTELAGADHDIPDYVHIDKLLAASEDDEPEPVSKGALKSMLVWPISKI